MTEHNDPTAGATPENDMSPESEMPVSGTSLSSGQKSQQDDSARDKKTSPELARFWEAVKRLPAYVKLVTAIMRDPDVPKAAKVVLGIGGGYAISPIDLVPGIIPVVGQMDDVYAMLTALQQSLKRMPDDLANKHLEAAGVSRDLIDGDLASVRAVAKLAVVKSVKFGGRALGRISRAAINFTNDQLERRDTRRREAAGE